MASSSLLSDNPDGDEAMGSLLSDNPDGNEAMGSLDGDSFDHNEAMSSLDGKMEVDDSPAGIDDFDEVYVCIHVKTTPALVEYVTEKGQVMYSYKDNVGNRRSNLLAYVTDCGLVEYRDCDQRSSTPGDLSEKCKKERRSLIECKNIYYNILILINCFFSTL